MLDFLTTIKSLNEEWLELLVRREKIKTPEVLLAKLQEIIESFQREVETHKTQPDLDPWVIYGLDPAHREEFLEHMKKIRNQLIALFKL